MNLGSCMVISRVVVRRREEFWGGGRKGILTWEAGMVTV